jgi:hypothetical protein
LSAASIEFTLAGACVAAMRALYAIALSFVTASPSSQSANAVSSRTYFAIVFEARSSAARCAV